MSDQRARRGAEQRPIQGRLPAHDLDAEAAVLSAVLLSARAPSARDAFDRVLATLKPEHFYSGPNAKIYEAALALHADGTPLDEVSIASWLRDRERLAWVGGADYIAQLVDKTPALHHVETHAEIVRAKWVQRSVGALGHRVAAESYFDVGELAEWVSRIQRELHELGDARRAPSGEYLHGILQRLFAAKHDNPEAPTGTGGRTGYHSYDRMTSGVQPGKLSIVAARPGCGKSSWARGLAVGAAKASGPEHVGAAIFSLEMTREEVALGMICSEAEVNAKMWKENTLEKQHWDALTLAASRIAALGIVIDDTTALSLAELRARAMRYAADYDRPAEDGRRARRLALVVVDYVQLMKGSPRPGGSRQQELGEISRGLKELAKDLRVHVVALAAMNRDAEKQRRRPVLSDLRECGDLESDADEVMFIHQAVDDDARPARRKGERASEPAEGPEKGVAELIIRKQRGGETGTIRMRWVPEVTRFFDLSTWEPP